MDHDLQARISDLDKQLGILMTKMDNHSSADEKWFSRHEEFHRDYERERRARNWQMWMLIIGVGISIVVSVAKGLS